MEDDERFTYGMAESTRILLYGSLEDLAALEASLTDWYDVSTSEFWETPFMD